MKTYDFERLYNNGRYYDLQTQDIIEDIPFFIRQAKKYGDPILEIAVGTGRIAIPLAEEGFQISGIDVMDSMLEVGINKAAHHNVSVEFIKADCQMFNLKKKFKLIIFPANSLTHLHTTEAVKKCFLQIQQHLAPGGRFILTFFNPDLSILCRDSSKLYPIAEYHTSDEKGFVEVSEKNIYNRATQINRIEWFYKFKDKKHNFSVENNMRIFFPQELDALLKFCGFTIENKYGDYKEKPFNSASKMQILVCKKDKIKS